MKAPITILYFSPHPTHDIVSPVGYSTHQRETIGALEQRGNRVIKLIMGGETQEEVNSYHSVITNPSWYKKILKTWVPKFIWSTIRDVYTIRFDSQVAKRLEQQLVKEMPDLLYERSEYMQSSAIALVKKHQIPYFVEVNAPFVQEMRAMQGFSLLQWLGHIKEKKKYKAADRIFAVSNVLKDFLVKKYGIDPLKIEVAPNRINAAQFYGGEYERYLKFDLLKAEQPVVGFIGSLLPHHKVHVLIRATKILLEQDVDLKLIIIGDGSVLPSLKNLVVKLGLIEQVSFMGSLEHSVIPQWIAIMDIAIMPGSNWYCSPMKIFEYGALAKPIIAPDFGPLRDVMEHKVDGLLIDPTAANVANAILYMLEHPEHAIEMGKNFRKKILKNYTWDQAAQQIEDAYYNLKN